MAQPTDYVRQFDFVDFETSHPPSTPKPGSALDAEFDAILVSLTETQNNLELIQRDDGKLRNESVHKDALDKTTLALMAGAWVPKGDWSPGTQYRIKDVTDQPNGDSYVCCADHVSGPDFSVDRGDDKWILISVGADQASLEVIRDDALMYRDQALAAADAAEGSADLADGSATSAANSASEAAASAAAAAASEGSIDADVAAAQAAAAAALVSANNAAASEVEAIASALAAAASEANALTSANAAALSETNAAASAVSADEHAASAYDALSQTLTLANSAGVSALAAENSATNAFSSASGASASAAAALASQNAAALSEANAAASASAAAVSATAADASADAAAISEANAANAATGAAGGDLAGNYPNPTLAVDRVKKTGDTMSGTLRGIVGAVGGVSFGVGVQQLYNGMYGHASQDEVNFAVSAVRRLQMTTTYQAWTLPHRMAVGSTAAPSYSFTNMVGGGLYYKSATALAMAVVGNDVMRWNSNLSTEALGPISVPADPTTALQLATKQYVDAQVAIPTTHVHPASAITNAPAGNIAATTVQAAIDELDSEKLNKSGSALFLGDTTVGAAAGPILVLSRSVVGAPGDMGGELRLRRQDASGVATDLLELTGFFGASAATASKSTIASLATWVNGAAARRFYFGAGQYHPSLTDPGDGGGNFKVLYVNNQRHRPLTIHSHLNPAGGSGSVEWTGIPSDVLEIVLCFYNCTTSGAASPLVIQGGTSAGYTGTGYLTHQTQLMNANLVSIQNIPYGFPFGPLAGPNTSGIYGIMRLTTLFNGGQHWHMDYHGVNPGVAGHAHISAGFVSLPDTLSKVLLTVSSGLFVAGAGISLYR